MKITMLSDSHCKHHQIKIDPTDLLIHAGDATASGTIAETKSFLSWFEAQPAQTKIYVGGNHDMMCQDAPVLFKALLSEHPTINYLEDSELSPMIGLRDSSGESIRIYGSPWSKEYGGWAFMSDEKGLNEKWDRIPENISLLVVHGPPHEILDLTLKGVNAGSKTLREQILGRIKPKIVCTAHIHEAYGQIKIDNTLFINASSCNRQYQPVNKPVTIEI